MKYLSLFGYLAASFTVVAFVGAVYFSGIRAANNQCEAQKLSQAISSNEEARGTLEKIDNETRKIPDSLLDSRLNDLGILRSDQDR